MTQTQRPDFHRFHNGSKAALPFSDAEYEARLASLRAIMRETGVTAAVFTSMHNIAYYSGFLYCAFGRPYGLVVTDTECVTISAGIDAGQPWRRSFGDNITYTDWQRNNYWRAIASVTRQGAVVGYEGDHMSLIQATAMDAFLNPTARVDLAQATMTQRLLFFSIIVINICLWGFRGCWAIGESYRYPRWIPIETLLVFHKL